MKTLIILVICLLATVASAQNQTYFVYDTETSGSSLVFQNGPFLVATPVQGKSSASVQSVPPKRCCSIFGGLDFWLNDKIDELFKSTPSIQNSR